MCKGVLKNDCRDVRGDQREAIGVYSAFYYKRKYRYRKLHTTSMWFSN